MGGPSLSNIGTAFDSTVTPPEVLLARLFKDKLGVEIEPQALRNFIRTQWNVASPLAHLINHK